ncbi:MAG: hypothetical protein OEM52_10310, partial [bacterium]|nr:hypothetical protein [bacterium]
EEAIEKSANSFTGGWSTDPLDLRALETDPRGFSIMIFERARELGFHQQVLELGVLATVFDLSEAKVLADVLKLEDSLDPHPVEIDELALILERYSILRREYVVARKMQSGGSFDNVAKLEEQIAPPPPLVEKAPIAVSTAKPSPEPMATPIPSEPVPATEPEKPLRPVSAKPPENRYELLATWRETFSNPKLKQSLMNALRTKNANAYDEWVDKVAQQTTWKVARIHIDNYLYVYGIERGTVLWERVMKTSIPFFPDAPQL